MSKLLVRCSFVALAMIAGPVCSQTAAPKPGPTVELAIALAVAEARCSGDHRKMVARYRPLVLSRQSRRFTLAGQQMALRYQQAHGDGWREALQADLVKIRTGFEQHPDLRKFCKQTAIQARFESNEHPEGVGSFRSMDVESYIHNLNNRIR